MKHPRRAMLILLIVFTLLTGLFLLLAPDIIPAHYNARGEVDRMGSKYEYLLFPAILWLFGGLVMLGVKKDVPNGKVIMTSLFIGLLPLAAIFLFLMGAALRRGGASLPGTHELILKVSALCIGVPLLFLANLMPKATRNGVFGLRTKWSMMNDALWQKSQRFGGISGVVTGLLIVFCALILPSHWPLTISMILILLWAAAGIWASYHYYKKQTS